MIRILYDLFFIHSAETNMSCIVYTLFETSDSTQHILSRTLTSKSKQNNKLIWLIFFAHLPYTLNQNTEIFISKPNERKVFNFVHKYFLRCLLHIQISLVIIILIVSKSKRAHCGYSAKTYSYSLWTFTLIEIIFNWLYQNALCVNRGSEVWKSIAVNKWCR